MVLAARKQESTVSAEPRSRSRRNRWYWALAALLGLVYVVSPIDIVPEAVTGPLGYVEDVLLAVGAAAFTLVKAKGYFKLIAISSAVIAAALFTIAVVGILVLIRVF